MICDNCKKEMKPMIKPRFTAELADCGAYEIVDNDCKKYNMPDKAVSLFFKHKTDAVNVANALCKEWYHFLANPT